MNAKTDEVRDHLNVENFVNMGEHINYRTKLAENRMTLAVGDLGPNFVKSAGLEIVLRDSENPLMLFNLTER